MDERDELLTPAEASRIAKCSVKAIYAWSAQRHFPRIQLGRLVRFKRSDIEAWIERNREPSVKA
jgi:excisionase family DNA binding protein